jgi:hypothetical protein
VRATDHSSGRERHDHQVVLSIVPSLERMIPVIEQLRDVSPRANDKDEKRHELENSPPHDRWMPSSLKTAEK